MKKIISLILAAVAVFSCFAVSAQAYIGSFERNLLDSATLIPQPTGYTPLDNIVEDFMTERFTSSMDSCDKLKACYDFLIYGSSYGSSTKTPAIYASIDSECNYYSNFDRRIVAEAYCFIRSKIGSCNDFAGAFMVMARALGFECYVMDGTISWYAGTNDHTWCLIKLGDSYYSFDPQAEWRNYDNNGTISYSNFCIPEGSQYSRSYNRDACIANYNGFLCRNKIVKPGKPIVGRESDVKPAYKKGEYVTNERMNFRAEHNTYCTVYCVIPEETKVKVTEVYDVWGKISYDGKTGWISLDYSTLIDAPDEATTKQAASSEYICGKYTLSANMNFRTAPDGTVITIIPGETTVKVTQTEDEWGKVSYNGTTGWISLQYSKLVSASVTGDANGDGKVTAGDARLILRHSVKLESIKKENRKNVDMDGNGLINAADSRTVLRIVTDAD